MSGVFSRLERRERWELTPDGSPKWARILCGKRSADGAQRCRGYLAWLGFGSSPVIRFEGMNLRDGGVWTPTIAALKVYERTGMLTEIDTERQEQHQRRHRKQRNQRDVALDSGLTSSPKAVCPRCHTEQSLIDAKDLATLRTSVLK